MRDPKRIEPFLKEIGQYWNLVPDWRFGQLLFNFLSIQETDCFFWEEDMFLQKFKEYISTVLDKS